MKKVLSEILDEQEVPDGVKDRLIKSAKAHLLLKDMASLFGSSAPKSAIDIVENVLSKPLKTKKL